MQISIPFSTIVGLFQARARQQPDKTAFVFLQDGEEEPARLTYGELDARARAVAALLQREGRGTEVGERALLLLPPGIELIEAFFGCLYAGVVAVPSDPPRLRAIVEGSRPRFVLTTFATAAEAPAFAEAVPALETVRWLVSEKPPAPLAARWRDPEVSPESPAFLQKGVTVRHGNLQAAEELIRQGFGLGGRPGCVLAEGTEAIEAIEAISLVDAPAQDVLSPGERGLWLLHRLEPADSAYHLTAAARIHGEASAPEIRAAFQSLVDRHEALRTTFAMGPDGEPVRIVHPRAEVCFAEHGASAWTDFELQRRIEEEAFLPFDLETGPLLRVSLFHRSAAERVLVVAVHHIAADFWSFGLMLRELAASLGGVPLGGDAPGYGEAARARDERVLQDGERLQRFWLDRLAGAPVLDLPFDRPRRLEGGGWTAGRTAGCRRLDLDPKLAAKLRRLARERGATLFTALLAGFQAVLHRYSGQTDLTTGSPAAGRPAGVKGIGKTVGYFVNPVSIRGDLAGGPGFGELVERTRARLAEALEHGGYPLPSIVEDLRRTGREEAPFRAMLVFHRSPADFPGFVRFAMGDGGGRLKLGPFELESLPLAPRSAQWDLTLTAGERDGGLGTGLIYDAGLIGAPEAERLLGHFVHLLAEAALAPEMPIAALPMLGEEERRQLLVEANGSGEEEPAWPTLQAAFAHQAAATPAAVAVIDGEERTTYEELAWRAGRLARHLRQLGAGPERVVGVYLDRTTDLVATLLGVLETGSAYLPLDPAYPGERLRLMAEDAGAELVVTRRGWEGGGRTVTLDWDRIGAESERPPTPAESGNLAYLIYTSGSTGRPKGVAIEHRSAVRRLAWAHRAYSRQELAGVLASTSIGFDLSVFELFVPLTCGGTVILAADALALPGLPAAGEVTLVNTVPSALAALLEAGGVPASVCTVNLAGEPLRRSLVERSYAAGIDRIENLYGPSEDTTYSTGARIERGEPGEPSIGRPLPGTRAYVLDRELGLLPSGVAGELGLGGAGLARGYLARPDLTAERFVPDPYGPAGSRLYRTGDRVRRRADGALDFLGRLDHQVKVRGFRIELGEVEAALAAHPDVAEAVAAARGEGVERRLVAYVVLAEGEGAPALSVLRKWLAERLPAAMVPSQWVFLDELPRTPNGKVDRKALPEPAAEEAAFYREPRGPVETWIAALWAELLGRERVGRDDDFFSFGGHSLLAARVVVRLREPFGVELPLRAVFDAPTPAGLAAAVERARGGAAPLPPVRPAPRDGDLPLSFAQERLWFLDRLKPGGAVYNVPAGLWLCGGLDIPALERALGEIVRRHEALRTVFAEIDGRPVQRIGPALGLPVARIDGSASPDPEAEARRLATEEARRPFDLETGPLVRAVLLSVGPREHLLVLTFHHIISDGASLRVLARELSALYSGESLAELPLQYADYAVWQRDWLSGPALGLQIDFWRGELAGSPAALELPTDRPRPAAQAFRGGTVPVEIPEDLSRGLRALSHRCGATPFLGLLAGFAALLSRYSGQEDVVVGSPVAGRALAETEGLIGFFVNSLPLRVDLAGDPPVSGLLGRVRERALAAWSHADVPFERLVQELRPERDLSRSPIFQALLTLGEDPLAEMSLPGLTARAEALSTGTAKLDLSLLLTEGERKITGELEYDADLFDAATAQRMAGHFGNLLRAMVEAPEQRLSEIEMLGEAERRQLLSEWGRTPGVPAVGAGLHELFEAQAERTPGAVAVIHGSESLTYRELARRAESLAAHLRGLGVEPEALVGVLAERTPALVAALLGILKAGGAYLPIDPAYPRERIAFLLADGGAPVLLTEARFVESLPPYGGRVVVMDEESPPGPFRFAGVEAAAEGEDLRDRLAYVIYTSGSTGTPKGVAIRHGSAVARLAWAASAYAPKHLARVLASTSICFDLSVFELFVPLSVGGAVVLADDALALPATTGVTLVNTVPSAMAELVRAGAVPASVRVVNLAGEPLRRELADRLHELPGIEAVYDLYGPSEDTTYSTGAQVERGGVREPAIGRPLPGTRARLLDAHLRLVPAGVPGELWLGGVGLARGYLGRPDLTADRFRPDPFAAVPGERLYRTGDLARWLPSGELDYLGRIDQQVKVRGYRIELGEVEAALAAHPEVSEAVAAARGEGEERRLVAYVVLAEGGGALSVLREWLAARLPAALIPSQWVVLPELPRTPNGKVDRKALPEPDRAEAPSSFVAPRTAGEEIVAGLWAGLLGLERVGIHDDFFALGGHSLLAVRAVSQLREPFGVELPLRAVFEAPTPAGLAAAVERALGGGLARISPIVPVPRTGDLPLSFFQERLWFLDRLAPGSAVYNIPAGVRLEGALDVAALSRGLAGIVRRHESLRTVFARAGDRPVQRVRPALPAALPIVDLAALPAPETESLRLAAEEAARPFDLEEGPLVRAVLLRLAPDDHLLAVNLHHIVADGWSLGLFARELSALYGGPPELPELPIQYADYAVWQQELGPALEGQIDFWRRELAGTPAALDLPVDRPRPAVQGLRGRFVPAAFSARLSQDLSALGRSQGATPFMALLAGFAAVLGRYSGQGDLVIGSPVANRVPAETAGLIGFFVNTLPLRVSWSEGTFGELLSRVRRTALAAYAHADVPFERLVKELHRERDLSRGPLFQVMLALGEDPLRDLHLRGLRSRPVPLHSGTAKLDLTLQLAESDGEIGGGLELDADLFDAATGERLLGHLATLLAGATADPGLPVAELPLLTPAEQAELLDACKVPAPGALTPGPSPAGRGENLGIQQDQGSLHPESLPSPIGRGAGGEGLLARRASVTATLHQLFEAQVGRTPEAVALIAGEERLSYRELDARAGLLARSLRSLGVKPEVRVALAFDRSPEMLVAVLGVLKAGGAYLPLDPAHPAERLAFVLRDGGAAVLLTESGLAASLPEHGLPFLCLDRGWGAGAPRIPGSLAPAAGPENLAYVLYTSGSTGRPKGVAVEHRSAVALARWAGETFSGAELAGVLAATSLTFDLSVFELFVPWSRGGAVILARDALALPSLTAREEVTLVNTVPSAMAELVRASLPPSVRVVNLAGEPLRRGLADEVYAAGAPRLLNLYGPTEDTVYSTWAEVPRVDVRPPVIGRPVTGTWAFVADRGFQPMPAGVPGELLLGGAGLARGYLGRPDLTAERWVPDPFSGEAGKRLYRTGDRVRRRPEGDFEYLGRIDQQVKVRGVRIELGEIEAAIVSHEEVREAVVAVLGEEGDRRLVAYVVGNLAADGRQGRRPLQEELQSSLEAMLPAAMVPSAWLVLPALPLTPNGKVDRKALPEPVWERRGEYAAPRTPVEEMLAAIWRELLGGVERVGVHDGFFELGGHSLLATRLASQLREAFGVEIPLRRLFEVPTIAGLAAEISRLRGLPGSVVSPIRRRGGDRFRLSFPQERLWFLDRLGAAGSAYNLAAALRFTGSLDLPAFAASLTEIVRRHEALRTRFEEAGGEPAQRVDPPIAVPVPVADLSGLEDPLTEAARLAREETAQPFDLAAGPLLRARLVRLSGNDHIAIFTVHHIASDGWSVGVLVRELAILYEAFLAGRPSPLPELPVQYGDFAEWQRERMSGETLAKLLDGWRERLDGAPEVIELPSDRLRPLTPSGRGREHISHISAERAAALSDLARRQGATPFMVLLAAFAALLSRLTGQDDLPIGSPVANRNRGETEGLIGFFVNTLVLRVDTSGSPGFLDLLARVREMALAAYDGQDLPFERLVEELAPVRSLAHAPLFQVMLSLQEAPLAGLRLPGVTASPFAVERTAAQLDLSLSFLQGAEGLTGTLEHSRDLFDPPTAARLAGHFETLLAAALANPQAPLSDLLLLDGAELHQVLREWNDTAGPAGEPGFVHGAFEAWARRAPEAEAIVFGDLSISYGDLDRWADRLAAHLRGLGVGPEVPVAVCLERSPDLIVALLAVLKAGGVYLPLDAAYPDDRLAYMLRDSRAGALLTQSALLPRWQGTGVPALCLDDLPPGPEPAGDTPELRPGHLAYLIYTSGSTGEPKGVAVEHGAASLHFSIMRESLELTSADRVLQFTSISFDMSLDQILPTLSAGAALVLRGEEVWSPAELLSKVAGHRVTLLDLPSAYWQQWMGEPLLSLPPDLRLLIVGGEAMPEEAARRWLASPSAARVVLLNGYGPTETLVTATWHRVTGPGRTPTVPIGRSLPHRSAHVADRQGHPLPPGVVGELYLGGLAARGYLHRPSLTAERFVPDPFSGVAGGRLYRTGDLVRRLPDGELEFLGRIDHQLKVRGFRVELGEVEAALLHHPAVATAAVLALESAGGLSLAGFVTPESLSPAELRAFLRESLPDYMVPAVFVTLDALPLTSNGKVDRRALARLEAGRPGRGSGTRTEPRTPAERRLATIWEELLGLDHAGPDDDFFEVGGHSLQGIRLVARIREAFGVELPVRAVFETPVLADLAARLEAADVSRHAPIRLLENRTGPLPMSFAQERLWFLEQLEPGTAFYNIPEAVRMTGALRPAVLEASLTAVAQRHESLRTTFGDLDGRPFQVVTRAAEPADVAVPLPRIDLSGLAGPTREAEARRLATAEARSPFDLALGPLMRARLFALGPDEHALLLNTHHIVSDGWSSGVFLREVAAFYQAFSEERPPSSLAPLTIQYADYAAWQRERLQGEVLEAQLAYWREQLGGNPGLELPGDRPRPAVETFRGASWPVALTPQVTRGLNELSRGAGVSLFMTLLAAFQTLLLRYTGQTDVPVGSPIANRNRPETEGVIGFFANTVVLRTDLGGNPTFRQLLGRVREVTLGAYSHEELPFGKLVEEVQPERDMSRNPLFQVMCVLQNQPREAVTVGGLEMVPIHLDPGIAKFDLTVFWQEEGDRLAGLVEHNTDLFDGSTVRRFYHHQELLFEAVLADADRPLLSLPLLAESERHQLLTEWNGPGAEEVQPARCVHEWVEEQAARTPEAVAAVFEDRRLTYGELNVRANRLAHVLRRRGVGPEALVGICVERSIPMVVAALAVLKAGGALVALDPAYPVERLATIIEDAGLAVLLTQEPLLRHFPGREEISLLLTDGDLFLEESAENPVSGVQPENPMYGIYTSGSTGQPKGILVPHRAFANLLAWQLRESALAPRTRTVQLSTFGFCVSFQEIFSAWCSEGTLVLAGEMTRRDIDGLPAFLAAERVERLHLPYAALKHLADAAAGFGGGGRLPGSLREVITAGEQLRVTPAVRALFDRLPGCTLANQYGASETHVVSALTLPGGPGDWPAIPAVGRTIANVRIHLLDEALEPVPVGVRGELYAGGACLPRGYLKDPALTAAKIVPDPYGERGGRLYRTGDLARYLADGRIEYLGRIDGQVKVRGFRVELGEVETVLARQPGVRDGAVVALAAGKGTADHRLVAYVVPEEPEEGAQPADLLASLRQALKRSLPEYMVPSVFMPIAALPVNANGKLDQAALPVPEDGRVSTGHVAPRGPVEEGLAGIWTEVLDPPANVRVGAADSFFDLGGHSLLATQVISRARAAFGVDLTLRALFEAPTVAELARRIEVLRAAGAASEEAPPLVSVPRSGPVPLSFAQERLWFLDQLNPGSAAYNMPLAVRLGGALDVRAFAAALAGIVLRHDALRTVFLTSGGAPLQVVRPLEETDFELPLVDLSALRERGEEEARRLAVEEAGRPFDLASGPLLRPYLLRVGPNVGAGLAPARVGASPTPRSEGEVAHIILLTLHHIVSDGWSMGVLVRELGALYGAALEGRPSPLPPLPIQYTDFALWQRTWLAGARLEREIAYWRDHLAGLPARLDLPADHPRPAVRTDRGAARPAVFSEAIAAPLRALARREGATLFMALAAGFEALLGRLSGQPVFGLGTPVAGRDRVETEGLIGFFVNTLVLRADLSGDPAFEDLLGRVRSETLAAYAHASVPFEKLVEELVPERSLGHTPLFQVVLALQNAISGEEKLELPGTASSLFSVPAASAKFDLTLSLAEAGGGLEGTLEHSADLFDPATAERLLGCFTTLLVAAIADPARPLSELPLLADAERHQLLREWNLVHDPAPGPSIPERFELQVCRAPEALAIEFGAVRLTYRELDGHANRLANRLRALGVQPSDRVAVGLERSPGLIVAMLGILKAGAAYAPLDPSYPEERLALLLGDLLRGISAPVLVTEGALFPVPSGTAILVLEETAGGSTESPEGPGVRVTERDTAYVLFTSGSTGQPKGVAVPHRAVVSLVVDVDYVRLGPDDRIAHLSNVSFDAATFEVWGALLNGGCVVGIDRETVLAPAALAAHLVAERITAAFLTTSLFHLIAGEAPESFRPLGSLLVGGEALDPRWAREVLEKGAPGRLLNVYGPTESTTFASWHLLREAPPETGLVPIGRPLRSRRLHVLDPALDAAPVGVAGDLYVGGDGVAHGYLGQPALTADRFVPDPFAAEPGARLYRTGDRARFRPDGIVDFLGRLDDQVKLRGFRIELGEVEAALAAHPGVRQAAVVVWEGAESSDRRLAAYAVVRDGSDADSLRRGLEGRLPSYMVPGLIVLLDELPLTPTGKVDRKALARREPISLAPAVVKARPRSPVEELLAGIFTEVLGGPAVGVEDDFFERGGHSLLATRLVSRVRDAFSVELPLAALFERPTVAGLAQVVEAAARSASESGARPPIEPVSREAGELPLSFAQQRLWVLHQIEPESPAYNVPLPLQVAGALDPALLAAALSGVVARHEALRTRFAEAARRPVQVIDPPAPVALPVIDLRALPDPARAAEARRQAEQEARRPFDLAFGPLLRASLLRIEGESWILLLTLHHIVSDGWSMGVLVREASAYYEALARGTLPALPVLPVQSADFAVWQRGWLAGDVLEAELAWWRERLAGAPPSLDLPGDRPRPAVRTDRGAVLPFALSAPLSEALAAFSRRQGATPFMTLLAAFALLLSRYTGLEDVVVGTPVAGRSHSRTEGLIGFFVNTLVLRTDLSGEPSFPELLRLVRESTLAAYAHSDVPFEKLVEELQPVRDLARTPLFQVMLALQNAPVEPLTVHGLAFEPVPVESGTAKFDLTATLAETENGIAGALEFSRDLFDAPAVERLGAHLAALIAAALEAPEEAVADLPMLSEAERSQLLRQWNEGRAFASGRTLPDLFSDQVRRDPAAVAVVCEERRLTYGELDTRAQRVAHRLRRLGVDAETRVGLYVERSVELVVGVLGILQAGGAYVPLDPAQPAERLAFLAEDALGARPLLVTTRGSAPPGLLEEARVVYLDEDIEGDGGVPLPAIAPESLAYVIYTSGSTGRPKGTLVTHANVVRLLEGARGWFGFGPSDIWTLFHSYAFDFSVWEIWGALAFGGRLVVVPYWISRSPDAFHELLVREGVTVLNQTPSAFRSLTQSAERAEKGTALRQVIFGGEAVDLAALAPWFELHGGGGPRLTNMYGITETTVHVTYRPLSPEDLREPYRSPIGVPLPDLGLHLLDARGRLVPVGVPGEIHVGGAGLSRGYLGRPELTAGRFVPDPFSTVAGERLYRSGDLARRRADGGLDFLGRIDHQVKVRGFRIELGEIEAVLGRHPAVGDVLVLAQEDRRKEVRLVAFVTGSNGSRPDAEELRGFLRRLLPDYMVPASFLVLDAFPLTANGKVDRRVLEAAADEPLPRPRSGGAFAAPESEMEKLVAGVWSEVLGLSGDAEIGLHDSFFDLGGHSLSIVQVQRRLRELLERDIAMVDLFRAPTIAALAQHLSGESPAGEAARQGGERAEARRALAAARRRHAPAEMLPEVEEVEEEAGVGS